MLRNAWVFALGVLVFCPLPSNAHLLINGDFEQGNTGFLTAYTYSPVPDPPETYAVDTNPHDVHPSFASYGDHTTGTGKMMIVNGATHADVALWEEVVAVEPNHIYQLSFWCATCYAMNPAAIACYVNGTLLGVTDAPSATGSWVETSYTWDSSDSTMATIRLVDMHYTIDGSGDDFTLDDITLTLLGSSGPAGAPLGDDYFYGLLQWLGFSNDPVNTATGNFTHQETDLSIMSRGMPLVFSRFYNSKDGGSSPLGPGWTHSYNISLVAGLSMVTVRWGDGRTDYWDRNGAVCEPNTVGLYDRLTTNGSTWTVTRKSLDVYNFDNTGRLASISDKNGNTTSLSYNEPGYPTLATAVTDPAGRMVTLGYTSGMLTSITDFAAPPRTVQYSYTDGRLTLVTDVMSNQIIYAYDPNGYLATIKDQRGIVTVTNTYDGQGRVISQRDGKGYTTQFEYDTPDAGQTTITDYYGNTTIHTHYTGYKLLLSMKDPLGHTVFYDYDEKGNRTAVADRNGHTTTFAYDNRGNVLSTVDPNVPGDPHDGGITRVEYGDANFPDLPTRKIDALGNTTQWEYDSRGNVIRQVDPNGRERLWAYNSFGQKVTEQDERGPGCSTQYIYDAQGKLSETINAEGNHAWLGYDTLWRLTQVTDGRGSSAGDPDHTTTTAYDNADRVLSVAGPTTGVSYQYDQVGNLRVTTNGRGYTTTYSYDNSNNVKWVRKYAPGGVGQWVTYAYDALNRKTRESDPNGNATFFTYDNAGRVIDVNGPEGNQTVYIYDAQGNVLSVTDASGVITSYEYDSLNRKVHQYDALGHTWQWQYDKLGRVTQQTDATDSVTRYTYDCLGRLTGVIDDQNNVTAYQYDAVGNLTQVRDARGIVTVRKLYDKVSRLVRQEDGLGNAYVFTYDGAGNRISRTDAESRLTTMVYDKENQLKEIHYPDATDVIYEYDGNGNVVSLTDAGGVSIYVYDQLDRLTSSTDSFGKQVGYGYNILNNRTSITYPADANKPARTVTYRYDRAHRLKTIADWEGRITEYTCDGAGRVTDVNYPNHVLEERSYDAAGRLASLSYQNASGTQLMSYSYSRDGEGAPVKVSEKGILDVLPSLPLRVGYTCDADNRLVESNEPAAYVYDKNGDLTSRTAKGITTVFGYDPENRLISQTTGGSTVQHIYDGRGNRIARNDNGSVTRYVLDQGRGMSHILCETDASGNIVAYYIHGPQIVGRIGADGSQRYYHTDQIGNVIALTDESQTVTDRYAYTPFGVPAGREGGTVNPFTYVGGLGVMADADGLYFMRARFYDPDAGRFLSKDPVESTLTLPFTLHPYLYASDSPAYFVDPRGTYFQNLLDYGHAGFDIVAGILGIQGAAAAEVPFVFAGLIAGGLGLATGDEVQVGRGAATIAFGADMFFESAEQSAQGVTNLYWGLDPKGPSQYVDIGEPMESYKLSKHILASQGDQNLYEELRLPWAFAGLWKVAMNYNKAVVYGNEAQYWRAEGNGFMAGAAGGLRDASASAWKIGLALQAIKLPSIYDNAVSLYETDVQRISGYIKGSGTK